MELLPIGLNELVTEVDLSKSGGRYSSTMDKWNPSTTFQYTFPSDYVRFDVMQPDFFNRMRTKSLEYRRSLKYTERSWSCMDDFPILSTAENNYINFAVSLESKELGSVQALNDVGDTIMIELFHNAQLVEEI